MEFKGLDTSDREDKYIAPIDVSENKAGRFLSLSVFLHAALVACVTMMSLPHVDLNTKEVVEFEVESDVAEMKAIPDGAPVPETQGPPPAPAPVAAEPVQELPKAAATKAETPAAPIAPVAKAPAQPVVKSAPVAAKAAPVAMADTLDDIETPQLETSDSGEVAVAQMDEKDLQDDFDKVDQEQNKALVVAQQSINEDLDNASAEGENALADVENENKAQAIAAAQAVEARRTKDAAAIASAQAAEQAAAEKAAAAKAAAAQKAALLAAEEEARRGQGTGGEGEGTGNSGSPEPTKEVAGIPGGVRSLEQLRQKPGNKFPQYASDERLARQEGRAVFYAYVNKDGTLSQFKLGQSTGHRNLDAKTLSALKKWKFYPGQEGWVEMPFRWALTGDALEAGGQLRK
ncbi:TonB family protein [Bdellovibrio sp. HCB337]|uniref:TonB family protein n=1 Tax=Bdellovibrio sp. HCB337 TaxID=3394358 RepID=UPI0039A40B6A